jgi:hypothetical protein
MFDKLAKIPSKSKSSSLPSLTETASFLACVRDQGFRLSYGALALAARQLSEDVNGQIPAQRGGKLVKALPLELQPFVCKKSGKYSKGVVWTVEVPSDLEDRPVITAEVISEAITVWDENRG